MSFLLLDPPITPYSAPAEIRAWLKRLAELAKDHEGDDAALDQIARARRQAEELLRSRET
jgi:hypothetical protein